MRGLPWTLDKSITMSQRYQWTRSRSNLRRVTGRAVVQMEKEMNQEEFIAAIKIAVHDSSIRGMNELLSSPPGRRPRPKLKRNSEWFNSLQETERQRVEDIITDSVHFTLFNFLCVLDGVKVIEDTVEKGRLQLYFTKNGEKTLLNSEVGEMLHDLYQSVVQDEVLGE